MAIDDELPGQGRLLPESWPPQPEPFPADPYNEDPYYPDPYAKL
jgi:hypothetical protein